MWSNNGGTLGKVTNTDGFVIIIPAQILKIVGL